MKLLAEDNTVSSTNEADIPEGDESAYQAAALTETLRQGKDYWHETPEGWIRVHLRPRRALFTPTGTRDGPKAHEVTAERVTTIAGSTKPIRDSWHEGNAHRALATTWTGSTWFCKRSQADAASSSKGDTPPPKRLL